MSSARTRSALSGENPGPPGLLTVNLSPETKREPSTCLGARALAQQLNKSASINCSSQANVGAAPDSRFVAQRSRRRKRGLRDSDRGAGKGHHRRAPTPRQNSGSLGRESQLPNRRRCFQNGGTIRKSLWPPPCCAHPSPGARSNPRRMEGPSAASSIHRAKFVQ